MIFLRLPSWEPLALPWPHVLHESDVLFLLLKSKEEWTFHVVAMHKQGWIGRNRDYQWGMRWIYEEGLKQNHEIWSWKKGSHVFQSKLLQRPWPSTPFQQSFHRCSFLRLLVRFQLLLLFLCSDHCTRGFICSIQNILGDLNNYYLLRGPVEVRIWNKGKLGGNCKISFSTLGFSLFLDRFHNTAQLYFPGALWPWRSSSTKPLLFLIFDLSLRLLSLSMLEISLSTVSCAKLISRQAEDGGLFLSLASRIPRRARASRESCACFFSFLSIYPSFCFYFCLIHWDWPCYLLSSVWFSWFVTILQWLSRFWLWNFFDNINGSRCISPDLVC